MLTCDFRCGEVADDRRVISQRAVYEHRARVARGEMRLASCSKRGALRRWFLCGDLMTVG